MTYGIRTTIADKAGEQLTLYLSDPYHQEEGWVLEKKDAAKLTLDQALSFLNRFSYETLFKQGANQTWATELTIFTL
jgi:hypothetical protein